MRHGTHAASPPPSYDFNWSSTACIIFPALHRHVLSTMSNLDRATHRPRMSEVKINGSPSSWSSINAGDYSGYTFTSSATAEKAFISSGAYNYFLTARPDVQPSTWKSVRVGDFTGYVLPDENGKDCFISSACYAYLSCHKWQL